MKRLIRGMFILVMMFVLTGCAKEQAEEVVRTVEPLVIESTKQNDIGTAIVYGQGVRESVFRGRIEIINDGTNGEEIVIVVYAGDAPWN